MKTGEILITIEKKDIYTLLKEHLGLQANQLSPFAEIMQSETSPSIHTENLKSLAASHDVVSCFKILSEPSVTYRIRIGGPAAMMGEMYICSTDHLSFVIASSFDMHSFGIQYCNTFENLVNFISSLILLDTDNKYEPRFPATMDYEFFLLLANIIDSYKYTFSRNALKHEASSILALSMTEFNMLLKNSLTKPDFSWLVTNINGLLPSAAAIKLQGKEKNYSYLFENGYLLAVKNNNNGEDRMVLNVLAIDAGAEFMNTWTRSAGIEKMETGEKGLEAKPLAFISSTALTNHYFNFSKGMENIHYETLNNKNSIAAIGKLFDTRHLAKPIENTEFGFCMNCGAKLKQNASFCSKCGNKIK